MSHDERGTAADIAQHRAAIDALDTEILARLNERARHAEEIGTLKGGVAAYRPEREAQVLARVTGANTQRSATTGHRQRTGSRCRSRR